METETKPIQDWQPIESAPKDGTKLLLWYPDYNQKVRVGHYYSTETYEHGKLKRKSEGWFCGTDPTISLLMKKANPTHWMPLPPAPPISTHEHI